MQRSMERGSRQSGGMEARLRILYVSPRKAYPPTSGARLRDFHFARSLAQRTALTYLFFGQEEDANQLRAQLEGALVRAIPAPRKYTASKVVRGVLGAVPLPVLNYSSAEMLKAITDELERERFDVVHLESLHLAGYLPAIQKMAPQALTVLDWHNIESELMNRFAENTSSPLKRVYARWTGRQLGMLEQSLLRECSGHIVCSDRELQRLQGLERGARIACLENGVDTARFCPLAIAEAPTLALEKLVFVGQMSYHANIEAAAWFVQAIWPAVRRALPRLTLSIVGSEPTPLVRALADTGAIEVTGTVADVLPYYRNAFASIVPLRTGGGTRLKILEAMATGTPVVSTDVGAEGLDVVAGEHIQVADEDPQSWVAAFRALADGGKRLRQTTAARELVARRYDWNTIGDQLTATYEGWVQSRLAEPAAHE